MITPLRINSILAGLEKLLTLVSLHWLGSIPVYMTDYTDSTSLRLRFQREVECFLRDEHCRRVVVIAHSMGTVIAYEGLTTALKQARIAHEPARAADKPISFVCLAPALRRLWQVAYTDPHRLRGVLPDNVKKWYCSGRASTPCPRVCSPGMRCPRVIRKVGRTRIQTSPIHIPPSRRALRVSRICQ